MNKDVIYIDVEDDITAIIGKIKASSEKIVALVPPKRIGVLQSAVNLRLLARMADDSNKRLVLVTNNKALIALSSIAKIPVAKNLQSKPEIAEIAVLEIDDGEDVIDGAKLPVGELAKTADSDQEEDVTEVIDTIDVEDEGPKLSKAIPTSGIKVPDFSRFRKKLFLGGFVGVLLIIFLVWATQSAPAATVIITAKTSQANVSFPVTLGGTVATDVSKAVIQTVSKQIKKDVSVDFAATGQKDIGEKAKGTITIENCDGVKPITIPANTVFVASSGENFTNASQAIVPGMDPDGSASKCQTDGTGAGTIDVSVVAEQSGTSYNIGATTYLITGVDSDRFVYANGDQMAGGTTKVATVVTATDVQKASQALVDLSSDNVKQQLIKQFINGEVVIADSFNVGRAAAVSVPAIGAEATSKAKLTSSTTYSMTAIAKSELETYLNDALKKQVDKNQRVYNNGIDKAVLSGYLKTDSGATINVAATGKIGPNIDQAAIKEQVKGKRFGDIQALISDIEGVSNVEVKFSYFWVATVPNDINKIDVEFKLQDA